jgi:hypothetical protein
VPRLKTDSDRRQGAVDPCFAVHGIARSFCTKQSTLALESGEKLAVFITFGFAL